MRAQHGAEALKALKAGVLTWQNRITRTSVRQRDLFGRCLTAMVIRTSNAYVFRDPMAVVFGVPAAKSENPTGTQNLELNPASLPALDANQPLDRALLQLQQSLQQGRLLMNRSDTAARAS